MIFKNISFKVKILIAIFVAMFIPTVTVSTIMYIKSEKAITDQTSLTITNSMDFVIGNIDSSLEIIKDMSMSILTDDRLISIVNSNGVFIRGDRAQRYSEVRDLLSAFSNRIKNTYMLNGIDSYCLYIPSQKTLIDSKSTYYENIDRKDVGFMNKLYSNQNSDSWFTTYSFEYSTLGLDQSRLTGKKLITCNCPLRGDDGSIKAVLAINVDANFINDNLNKIQTGTFGEILAMDSDEKFVAYSVKHITGENYRDYEGIDQIITSSLRNSGSFLQKRGKENDLIIYSVSKYTGWKYVVIIPTTQILGKVLSEVKNFLVILIAAAVLFGLVTTYLLSYTFYKPLEMLVSAMQEIENRNLDVRIDDKRGDEYHKVYKGFNDMVSELNHVLKDLVSEKLLKKEADIKLLQAQINPHFLYNTLESIHSIAKIKKVDEISLMVSALSRFFRISLSGGKDIVTLREAVDLVLSYLTIQNTRFNGKIEYTVNIPNELMECMVPKLILQPVVENSIYHGIEKRKSAGLLSISGSPEKEDLLLVVEDNGVGIPEDKLAEIRQSLDNDRFEDSDNFALKNLNRQIKLKYGAGYGVYIDSNTGQGTRVTIRIPIILERGVR